jgi:2,4-dienoyl-CoA reductase|tara:strand:+ start:157 stop:966 length:810 start_codon:yes stop_codon:yes gene_type:complete
MYHNKTILITGASSGLGRTLALKYAQQGGKIIHISRNISRINALQRQLEVINQQTHLSFSADVSQYQSIQKIQQELQCKNVYPDIIIHNAAGNFLCPFSDLSENGWKRIIDIVLHGSFNIYHIFGNAMIERKNPGIFLNISTTYADTGSALVIPSAVAKAGVDNLMRGLTVEWSPHDIRFVGIAPGPIQNSGGSSKLDPFRLFQYYNNYINPRKRMATQDEIAELSLFLTSKKADYINGEIIRIDGGEVVQNSGEFNFLTRIPFYNKII